MPLIRCSCQPSESLEAYFRRIHGNVDGNTLKHIPMVDVIRAFESAFPETTIYGLTSMFWLILLPEDDWRVQWLIRCGVNEEEDGKFEFTVEYLLPDSKKPWPDARVSGTVDNVTLMMEYVAIAMLESGGWNPSDELKLLAHRSN